MNLSASGRSKTKRPPQPHCAHMGLASRVLKRLQGHTLASCGGTAVTGLTVAKTTAKLGALWLFVTYVRFMVALVGGETLSAIHDGRPPPHRTAPALDAVRVREMPAQVARSLDALATAARRRSSLAGDDSDSGDE